MTAHDLSSFRRFRLAEMVPSWGDVRRKADLRPNHGMSAALRVPPPRELLWGRLQVEKLFVLGPAFTSRGCTEWSRRFSRRHALPFSFQ